MQTFEEVHTSSLPYRKERMSLVADSWGGVLLRDLFISYQIPELTLKRFRQAIGMYIARALDFDYSEDEEKFIQSVDSARDNRTNITPNGAVVPKSEFQIEYNLVIKVWCDLARQFISHNPELLKKFRLTPNIRIKFAKDLDENRGRGLDTALPHSDAWVEGPWGMNCHIPVFGDTDNNYLHFYKLRNELLFKDEFLALSPDYTSMEWTLKHYIDDSICPSKGCLHLSDYSLLHKTYRAPNCGTRVSVDTTMFVGEHDVLPDRESEYLDHIPVIGRELFLRCNRSESDPIMDKKSSFSHYTSGAIERIRLP
jgi:hypothetical protein